MFPLLVLSLIASVLVLLAQRIPRIGQSLAQGMKVFWTALKQLEDDFWNRKG